jgi:hypothetical protein
VAENERRDPPPGQAVLPWRVRLNDMLGVGLAAKVMTRCGQFGERTVEVSVSRLQRVGGYRVR